MGQQIPGQLTENKGKGKCDGVGMFNTTFNNISVISWWSGGNNVSDDKS